MHCAVRRSCAESTDTVAGFALHVSTRGRVQGGLSAVPGPNAQHHVYAACCRPLVEASAGCKHRNLHLSYTHRSVAALTVAGSPQPNTNRIEQPALACADIHSNISSQLCPILHLQGSLRRWWCFQCTQGPAMPRAPHPLLQAMGVNCCSRAFASA
jgi:hypothetical protein